MVKDFIWEGDDWPLEVPPPFVWVTFGAQYTGPSFFLHNPIRKQGWVPVPCLTKDSFTMSPSGLRYEAHTQSMLPLCLAWAWTIRKDQGQTIKGTVELSFTLEKKKMSMVCHMLIFQNP
jgi:hypothetical protein